MDYDKLFHEEVARKWAEYCQLNSTKNKRVAILDSIQFMEIAQYFYELKNTK